MKDLGSTFLYAVEPQGPKDFNNTVQKITFRPNIFSETVDVTIDIFDDAINEADEGFLIVVRVDLAASHLQDILSAVLDQNYSVALVTILNDDRT